MKKTIALRIDVDTFRGTGRGVPRLCEILAKFNVCGTFYFSVGPDNMGRHLWRLLKPAFLWKMLRTNAAGLYGPEIILMGTAWPGPGIGKHHADVIRNAVSSGHEHGFHAWDHHFAQAHLMDSTAETMRKELTRGIETLTRICGSAPKTTAAPGWRANNRLLSVKKEFDLTYNSDCRGNFPFYPILNGEKINQLQIPVTLPTYDEALGRNGVTDANYNDFQISLLKEDDLNVLTIHAEAEGGRCAPMFEDYLKRVLASGYRVIPLGLAAQEAAATAPAGNMILADFPGREGQLAIQS